MEPANSTMDLEKGMAGLCIIQRISFQRSSGCFAPFGPTRPQPPAWTMGLTPPLGGSAAVPTSGGSPPTTAAVILVSISTSRTTSTETTFLSTALWVAL
jgi:hypothetical protein